MNIALKNQQGVALITVMLIVALAAILATQMNARLLLQLQKSTNIGMNQQAYWYAMGAETFSKRLLLEVAKKESNITTLKQKWASGENTFPVENGTITGEIIDTQACFNLNALRVDKKASTSRLASRNGARDTEVKGNELKGSEQKAASGTKKAAKSKQQSQLAKAALIELITNLDIEEVDNFSAEYMVDALIDWLDKDTIISSAGGAEDNDYAAKEFAYLPANNYLASVNELRVIEHFSVPVINALRDYVCVIPQSNVYKINVNTIKTEQSLLLQATLGVSRGDAEQIIAARPEDGFASIEDFFNLPELQALKIDDNKKQVFVVDSEYFTLKTKAKFGDSYFSMRSLLHVIDNKDVAVLSRTLGL